MSASGAPGGGSSRQYLRRGSVQQAGDAEASRSREAIVPQPERRQAVRGF